MKKRGGKNTKPQLFSHIASAIIPSVGIIAVPSAAYHLPKQKVRADEEWGPLASTLLRASSTGQLFLPSSTTMSSQQLQYTNLRQRRLQDRSDTTTDDDESDVEDDRQRKSRQISKQSTAKGNVSRSTSLSDAEKRLFGTSARNEESSLTENGAGSNPRIPLDPRQALTNELSRSTDEKLAKNTSVTIARQNSPLVLNPVQSQAGPTSARSGVKTDGIGGESRSTTTIPRSSFNDTTIPASARSVSFKEPIADENEYLLSAKSAHTNSALRDIIVPPPEEYQQNLNELERRNVFLNDEVQQLRLNNRVLQKQHEALLDRLQTSQKLSQQELRDLLRQSGQDRARDLENLATTLQTHCDQLQNELISMKDKYAQSQSQSSLQELKKENYFLKDYVHRLNSALNEYQAMYPTKSLTKDTNKDQPRLQGLPLKGPSPIWLLNQKYLAPLFVFYDEKVNESRELLKKARTELEELKHQAKSITDENIALHERLSRSKTLGNDDGQLSDIEQVKRQAYLVLEENKVLQEQLDLQTNRLNDVQKTQIQEVSTLTRRLMIVESEKVENDRILETIRIRNGDLKRRYDQLLIDNNHRIHVQEHVQEIGEMKRLTDELSEKHAHEMELILRRVQDAETVKRISQLKLTENRGEIERLKGEIRATKKQNKKLQLRVQTFEKKLELQQVKEHRITTLLDKANEEFEQTKLERDTYFALAKTKEEEMNKTKAQLNQDSEKLSELEERLENYKSKNKERANEVQEQVKKQHENLKLRCLEYEQRIQQLISLLNEKQALVDSLNSEKRLLEVDLETIWQATNADSIHIKEKLIDMRFVS